MKKKRIILLYWIIATTLFIPSVSYAYIDPATTTYLIQIATAIVITIGVSLSIFFYKFRMLYENSKIYISKLKIRFSKKQNEKNLRNKNGLNNENEAHAVNADETGLEYAIPVRETFPGVVPPPVRVREASEPTKKEGKLEWLTKDDRKYSKRLLLCALMFAAISFTFIIFGIIELVISNENDLAFSYLDILAPTLIIGLVCFAIPTIIISFFRGRLLDVILCLSMILLVGGYLQGNFLNIDLGTLTGDTIRWEHYGGVMLKNTLVWGLIAAVIVTIRYFASKYWTQICIFVPGLIIGIQLVALISILPAEGEIKPTAGGDVKPTLTMEGLNVVSENNNIFYIVLDRLDDEYVSEIQESDPSFFDQLDGFTRFTNYTAKYLSTFPSVAEALTGKMYYGETNSIDYFKEAYAEGTLLPGLLEKDFDVSLFMSERYGYGTIDDIDDFASNISEIEVKINDRYVIKRLLQLSAYKYSPIALKPAFWLSSSSFDNGVFDYKGYTPWVDDDPFVYEFLKNHPVEVNEDLVNAFKYIHLRGPHPPIEWNENLERVKSGSSGIKQAKGSFKLVFDYLDQLRELGLYESSTIIITADHGAGELKDDPAVVGLFVKPAGSEGGALEYSAAPVTTDNLRATISRAADGNPIKPIERPDAERSIDSTHLTLPGKIDYDPTFFEVPEDADVLRVMYAYIKIGKGTSIRDDYRIRKYEIQGNAQDWKNWKEVDRFQVDYWG